MIAALLVSRYFITWKSLKNLVTISAILTVLPMANLASPLVASWKIRTAPRELYDACRPYGEKFPILYDLIITSRDFIMPVDVAVIHPTGVYLYCPEEGDRYQGGGKVFKRDADRMEVRRKRQDHDGKEKFPHPAFHLEKCH